MTRTRRPEKPQITQIDADQAPARPILDAGSWMLDPPPARRRQRNHTQSAAHRPVIPKAAGRGALGEKRRLMAVAEGVGTRAGGGLRPPAGSAESQAAKRRSIWAGVLWNSPRTPHPDSSSLAALVPRNDKRGEVRRWSFRGWWRLCVSVPLWSITGGRGRSERSLCLRGSRMDAGGRRPSALPPGRETNRKSRRRMKAVRQKTADSADHRG
jgi:hypothetical protein